MAKKLKTGWVKVATSGVTVDYSGRVIQKPWLKAIAENYDPEVYSARIWPDHYRFYPNGGKVLALKTQKATNENLDGEIHLMAILAPNDWLIEQNRQGQYVHSSIEVREDFMDGKFNFYLGGLGVTDDEASAGTDELEFSAKGKDIGHVFKGEKINLAAEVKESFFSSLIPRQTQTDDDEMKPEQFAAFQKLIEANTNALSTMSASFSAIQQKLEAAPGGEEPGTPSAGEDEPEMVTAEQFKAVQDTLAATTEQLEKLNTEFAALRAAPAGGTQVPDGDGGAEGEQLI